MNVNRSGFLHNSCLSLIIMIIGRVVDTSGYGLVRLKINRDKIIGKYVMLPYHNIYVEIIFLRKNSKKYIPINFYSITDQKINHISILYSNILE